MPPKLMFAASATWRMVRRFTPPRSMSWATARYISLRRRNPSSGGRPGFPNMAVHSSEQTPGLLSFGRASDQDSCLSTSPATSGGSSNARVERHTPPRRTRSVNTLILVLRLLHIVSGAFWLGSVIFAVLLVEPTAKAFGAGGQRFLA